MAQRSAAAGAGHDREAAVIRRLFFWAFVLVVLHSAAARAEPRIALVVGNGAYHAVSALENPPRDAALMAETLEGLGFEVTLLSDASLADLRAGFADFGRALRAAGPEATGLFYYAGHGVQSFGSNYLLPVDAAPTDAADLDLVAIEAQSVLRQMASAKNRANIVILDACRNNPFASIPDLNDNGLAEMKAPTGTFLAYATEPQAVALDGTDGNSPFTRALASEMVKPGVPLEQMFKQVRVSVLEATGGLQTPWDTSSMTVDFAFKAAGEVDLGEEQLWASVSASRDPVQIMLFMRAYPDGARAAEAKALLAEVMSAELGTAPAAPVVPAAPDPDEQAAFEAAQAQPSVETWESFIARHPDSTFRELAETELAALVEKSGTDPVSNPPHDQPVFGDLFFDQPLTAGGPDVEGRSMADIIQTSPLFPPIEGLPDEVWKGKQCKDCHEWTQQALCDQGKFYVNSGERLELGAIHPYGGQLRRVLKAWAEQGCR
jgi:hypothetical protein